MSALSTVSCVSGDEEVTARHTASALSRLSLSSYAVRRMSRFDFFRLVFPLHNEVSFSSTRIGRASEDHCSIPVLVEDQR